MVQVEYVDWSEMVFFFNILLINIFFYVFGHQPSFFFLFFCRSFLPMANIYRLCSINSLFNELLLSEASAVPSYFFCHLQEFYYLPFLPLFIPVYQFKKKQSFLVLISFITIFYSISFSFGFILPSITSSHPSLFLLLFILHETRTFPIRVTIACFLKKEFSLHTLWHR